MRRGWTLLEAVVVMTLAAVLVGLVGAILWGVLRTSGNQRAELTQQGVSGRLAEQFRADVAAAQECQPLDEQEPESGIMLSGLGERRVEYRPAEERLERTLYRGQHVEGRETYQLGAGRRVKLNISPKPPNVVGCILIDNASAGEPQDASIQRSTILAVLGRDQRFEHPGAKAPDAQSLDAAPDVPSAPAPEAP